MKKDRIGICLAGAGRAGMIHGTNFRSRVPGARLEAVFDPVEAAALSACGELEISKYHLKLENVLNDDKIDALVIASPTVFHKDMVIADARAGRHVFCEKPMAMDEQECD